jgi:hypothetical protein
MGPFSSGGVRVEFPPRLHGGRQHNTAFECVDPDDTGQRPKKCKVALSTKIRDLDVEGAGIDLADRRRNHFPPTEESADADGRSPMDLSEFPVCAFEEHYLPTLYPH